MGCGTSPYYTDKEIHMARRSILDQSFKYIPASKTDIAATFRRIRREMEAQAAKPKASVREIKRKAAA